jgi:hypothetical protein
MTEGQVKNLCKEFGMEMIDDYRNRIMYLNYVVGNYYFDIDCYKIAFIGSCVNTRNYKTARQEVMRKTREIKGYIANKKLKSISEDFE